MVKLSTLFFSLSIAFASVSATRGGGDDSDACPKGYKLYASSVSTSQFNASDSELLVSAFRASSGAAASALMNSTNP